jgi:hypothetical protein
MSVLTLPSTSFTRGVTLPVYSCKDKWKESYDTKGQFTGAHMTRTLVIDYNASTWRSYAPNYYTPLTDAPWMILLEVECTQLSSDPGRAEIVLTYRQDAPVYNSSEATTNPGNNNGGGGGSNVYAKLPESYSEENDSIVTENIQLHTKWTTTDASLGGKSMSYYWDASKNAFGQDAPKGLLGIKSFVVGCYSVSFHDFSWVKLNSPDNYVGKSVSLPGYSGGALLRNLCVSGYRSRQAGYWRRTLVIQRFIMPSTNHAAVFDFLYPSA